MGGLKKYYCNVKYSSHRRVREGRYKAKLMIMAPPLFLYNWNGLISMIKNQDEYQASPQLLQCALLAHPNDHPQQVNSQVQ